MKDKKKYVNYLTALFCVAYGAVMLDISSLTFYSEILIKQLGITITQFSALSSASWLSFAGASIIVGIIADSTGLRKKFLSPLIICGGLFVILTSFTNNYFLILLLRFLSGGCVGSSQSMMMSIIAKNLTKNDYGRRNGVVSCGYAFLSSTVGPLLITRIVLSTSWKGSFVFSGLILLITGLTIQFTVDEVYYERIKSIDKKGVFLTSVKEVFTNRNFVLCLIIGCLECAGKISLGMFGPMYLLRIANLDTVTKGTCLSIMGLVYIPISLLMPTLADRFSSRRVMLFTFLFSFFAPLIMFVFRGSIVSVISFTIFGNWAAATVALFCYVIPKASLPEYLHGTANGLIMGLSVLFGACLWPLLMSRISGSDVGLVSVIGIVGLLYVCCLVLTLLIDETKFVRSK